MRVQATRVTSWAMASVLAVTVSAASASQFFGDAEPDDTASDQEQMLEQQDEAGAAEEGAAPVSEANGGDTAERAADEVDEAAMGGDSSEAPELPSEVGGSGGQMNVPAQQAQPTPDGGQAPVQPGEAHDDLPTTDEMAITSEDATPAEMEQALLNMRLEHGLDLQKLRWKLEREELISEIEQMRAERRELSGQAPQGGGQPDQQQIEQAMLQQMMQEEQRQQESESASRGADLSLVGVRGEDALIRVGDDVERVSSGEEVADWTVRNVGFHSVEIARDGDVRELVVER